MKETPTTDFAFVPRSVWRGDKHTTIKILKRRYVREDGSSIWKDVPTYTEEDLAAMEKNRRAEQGVTPLAGAE